MGKSPCYEGDQGLKRGPWTSEEDQKLLAYVQQHGHGSWRFLPKKAGLQRCGKSCRLRWINYLRPDIKRGKFTLHEERTIIQLHALLGNRWSAIATHMPKRTDNEIKNYWNTHLKKRLAMMGIDPVTHKPSRETLGSANADPKDISNLSHIAQWERTRLEAEARLVRESKVIKSGLATSQDEPAVLSPEQILKKMPTTFGPPRWQARLFTNCLQRGDAGAPVFGSDCLKSDGSQAVPAGRSMNNGFDRQFADFDAVGDWNVELDHTRFGHNDDGNVMEASVELSEVNKNSNYWNDILHLVINCEPSDLPVF